MSSSSVEEVDFFLCNDDEVVFILPPPLFCTGLWSPGDPGDAILVDPIDDIGEKTGLLM